MAPEMFMLSPRMEGWVIFKMNGTLSITIQPRILLFVSHFLHEPIQINSLLASIALSYFASTIETETIICNLKSFLLLFHLKTYTWCSSCYLYHMQNMSQHILIEQCLNLQSIILEY